ncbi:MAG: transglutaminase domain-containing protein [Phycisphaerales bacterium]|nr:transglutaminase domain-containing protein [Phycisphaerales bacterium]
MAVDARVQSLADAACGTETDVARQVMMLIDAVANNADHYSINSDVPTCGRGAASDCLAHGGGCCTDLHSLFIAMARARGIPARMQYGYRLLDGREGESYNPGYRCWVEFFVPGSGWLATDIVAADNAKLSAHDWVTLSSTRIWLWSGRSFTLEPANASGPVDTMIAGWVEVDGEPIDPLPAADGTPSRVGRTLKYEVIKNTRTERTPALPQ